MSRFEISAYKASTLPLRYSFSLLWREDNTSQHLMGTQPDQSMAAVGSTWGASYGTIYFQLCLCSYVAQQRDIPCYEAKVIFSKFCFWEA